MPDDPLIGFDADGLRFEGLLGRGAMGAVYKGTQVGLNRAVAIKVIAPHLAEDQTYLDRFLREGRTLGRLKHPHIIACHDIVRTKGPSGGELVLMALEFVDGWSLGALLKKKHRLTARQVIELHRQAAEGLAVAHQLGIVHRDVKPDNIMVTRKGQAKLADFGLAKGEESAMLTQTGAIMGSPSYMAPEACRGEPPTPSGDCYSLGCSLYQALTGVTPYRANSAVQALHQHIHAAIPRLSARRPDLKTLDPLMAKLLAKQPQDRFANASEIGTALKAAQADIPPDAPAGVSTAEPSNTTDPTVAAHHATQTLLRPTTTPVPVPRKKRWPWVVVGIVILFLLLIAGGEDRPKTDTGLSRDDAILSANLDNIEALLDKGQIIAAEVVLEQLSTDDLPTSGPLAKRLASVRERVKAPPAPTSTATSTVATRKIDHVGEAGKLLADGDVDAAERMLNEAPDTPDQAAHRFTLRGRLKQALQEQNDNADLRLKSIEMQLNNGQNDEARRQLETLVLPKLASEELRVRHRRLLDKAKINSSSSLTHLRIGTPGFDGKDMPIGATNLPFHLPAGITQVAYAPTGVLTLRLPKNVKAGQGGVVALIAASESSAARVTLLLGSKRVPLPAINLEADVWTPVIVPLTGSDPATGIEFSVSESNRKSRLYGAGAVFNATSAATLADLALVPGGLRPMAVAITNRDGPHDYIAGAIRLAASNAGFSKLDRVMLATPNGSSDTANKLLAGLTKFLELSPPTASDPRIVTFDDANSLDAAFDAALISRTHLMVVVVNTNKEPTRTTVAKLVKRCRDALAKGTLPVLMFSHHYESNEWQRAWEEYVAAVQRELPALPIIDGGAAPRFLRINHVSINEATAERLRDDSIHAGFVELITRLRTVLTLSGANR